MYKTDTSFFRRRNALLASPVEQGGNFFFSIIKSSLISINNVHTPTYVYLYTHVHSQTGCKTIARRKANSPLLLFLRRKKKKIVPQKLVLHRTWKGLFLFLLRIYRFTPPGERGWGVCGTYTAQGTDDDESKTKGMVRCFFLAYFTAARACGKKVRHK